MKRFSLIFLGVVIGTLFGCTVANAAEIYCQVGIKCEGTQGADRIHGTSVGDWIVAKGGGDVVDGNGGNDTIEGGGGPDTLRGESGHDRLEGGGGDDTLDGMLNNNCSFDNFLGGDGWDTALYRIGVGNTFSGIEEKFGYPCPA